MFDDSPFAHYLTYGATDQRTVRELRGAFSGLMVPGTVAAFQREGTGGFVLTLSATTSAVPYVIDPRFPLFQTRLSDPKSSHTELALVMGDKKLVNKKRDPTPADFDDNRISTIAKAWVEFNVRYTQHASAKFDKYAKRLNEEVTPKGSSGPKYVIAPYFMAADSADPWWTVSAKLYEQTRHHLGNARDMAVRVVAASDPRGLSSLLSSVKENRAGIWASGLDELTLDSDSLVHYGAAIAEFPDKSLFAMYGGFFSVLLSAVGLSGACHGIGFGESRAYPELSKSGPPPARYYHPQTHRYIQRDLAVVLYDADPALVECSCKVCKDRDPGELEYHDLMMHSVHCRNREIQEWCGLDVSASAGRLAEERDAFLERLGDSGIKDPARREAERTTRHIARWIGALTQLGSNGA